MQTEIVLFTVFLAVVNCKTALFKIEGEVNAEEFTYYKIIHPGNILLVLESLEGDADIYISDKTATPNYNPENYELHSATCGTDTVFIPQSFKRPMIIGIYGHFLHKKSRFAMQVYQLPDSENYFDEDEDRSDASQENSDNVDNSQEKKEVRKSQINKGKRRGKNLQNGLWPLLELFEMLFL